MVLLLLTWSSTILWKTQKNKKKKKFRGVSFSFERLALRIYLGGNNTVAWLRRGVCDRCHDCLELAGRFGFPAATRPKGPAGRRLRPEGAVSRIERQSDFLLSTLREYVGALGGQLELRAAFPDGEFVIDTFAEEKPRRKRRPRAKAAA